MVHPDQPADVSARQVTNLQPVMGFGKLAIIGSEAAAETKCVPFLMRAAICEQRTWSMSIAEYHMNYIISLMAEYTDLNEQPQCLHSVLKLHAFVDRMPESNGHRTNSTKLIQAFESVQCNAGHCGPM